MRSRARPKTKPAKSKPKAKRPPLPIKGLFESGYDPDPKTLAAVQRYVESGVDINELIKAKHVFMQSLLHLATGPHHIEIMRYLLERGADVELADGGAGETPMEMATGFVDDPRAVALLLEFGADINGRGGRLTPLQSAVESGHPTIVQFLLDKGAKLDEKSCAICRDQLRDLPHRGSDYQAVLAVLERWSNKR